MKIRALYLIALCALPWPASGTVHREFTKTSAEELSIERGLLDFFDRLREQDAEARREFRATMAPLQIPNGRLDSVRIPTVVLWYPSTQRFTPAGLMSADSTYLLMLPVGSTTEAEESVSACVIAEFHVVYKAKRRIQANPPAAGTLISNTLTISFRGFRLSRSQLGPKA